MKNVQLCYPHHLFLCRERGGGGDGLLLFFMGHLQEMTPAVAVIIFFPSKDPFVIPLRGFSVDFPISQYDLHPRREPGIRPRVFLFHSSVDPGSGATAPQPAHPKQRGGRGQQWAVGYHPRRSATSPNTPPSPVSLSSVSGSLNRGLLLGA
jgi:hypothetical protein